MSNDLQRISRTEEAQAIWVEALELRDRKQILAAMGMAWQIEAGHILKRVRDGNFSAELKFANVEEFAQEVLCVDRATAYRYIKLVEQFTEKLPEDIVARATNGPNALPMTTLAALHFDHEKLTPEEFERLRKLPEEELPKELVRLGYDRKSMGGRGPSDLLRHRLPRTAYRDQNKQLSQEREKRKRLEAEKKELLANLETLKSEKDKEHQALLADDKTRALQIQIDHLQERMAAIAATEAAAAVQKVDREFVMRRLIDLQANIGIMLGVFQLEVQLPDMESAAAFDVGCDSLINDIGNFREAVAHPFLESIDEEHVDGAYGAAQAVHELTAATRKRMAKWFRDEGLIDEPGKK